jgi:hyperosmotically inducible protein
MRIFSPLKKFAFILAAVFALTSVSVVYANPDPSAPSANLTKQIRHELVTLPYYGVFDNLAFKVEGDTVTLYGQVVRPTTRSDAQYRVAHLPGVARVVNNIQVLPLSSFDDSIRIRAYRTIFSYGGLYRYAMGANPSIHIIVDNGRLTLEGVVDNKGDANLAYIAARTVPGVFSVTNNLQYPGSAAR